MREQVTNRRCVAVAAGLALAASLGCGIATAQADEATAGDELVYGSGSSAAEAPAADDHRVTAEEDRSAQGPVAPEVDRQDSGQSGDAGQATTQAAPAPTARAAEPAHADGWAQEADGWHYYENGTSATGWRVLSVSRTGAQGYERYWFGSDGVLAQGRLVSPSEGSGYWAYATPDGTIARGKVASPDGTRVYLADNDGRLEDAGWHVTAEYGDGLQRYWVDATDHAAKVGYDDGEGDGSWAHYTTSAGYVLRGATRDGGMRYADNDGRLASGWLVTSDFGQGLQRYWVGDEGLVAKGELVSGSVAGYAAYATDDGPVVRGVWKSPDTGEVYLADNDGRLSGTGWVVADYGQGLQRYWVDPETNAAEPGLSKDGWAHYTTSEGYVLRGGDVVNGSKVYADNDGKLLDQGWLVTDAFGQGLQRYWFEDGAAVSGRIVPADRAGWTAYARDDGTILRGKLAVDGVMLLADNDGRLAWGSEGWMVTGAYDGGTLQRYYLTRSADGSFYGARLGRFTLGDGLSYYGREDAGYVVRGSWVAPSGELLYADNEGVLGTRIMGASQNDVDQMVAYYRSRGVAYPSAALAAGGAPDVRTFFSILCEEAAAEGVRAEVVFAQAMLETGWLQFGGDVKVGQYNFAGIGATGNGNPGNSFADVRTGLRAQVQHLKAYASTDPLNNPCVDPRFHYVRRGSAPTMEQLSSKWATDSGYGQSLSRILAGLNAY